MRKINNNELKKLQLNLLDEFIKICDKNNLTYYLAYGSALGAVRHNGYIPWDDDIDIEMPRDDYNRFLEICDSLQSNYYCCVYYPKNKNYGNYYAKLIDKRTTAVHQYINEVDEMGVYIDIFPLEIIHHRRTRFHTSYIIKAYMYLIQFSNMSELWYSSFFLKNIMKFFAYKLAHLHSPAYWIKLRNKRINKINMKKSDKTFYVSGSQILEKEIYGSGSKYIFEGRTVNLPCSYDAYLKHKFNNYMELPPAEKRISQHLESYYWI